MSFEAAGKRVGSLAVNIIRLAFAAVLLTLFCWIARGVPLPVDASGHAWLFLSLSGIVGFVIGDGCLFRALVLIGPRLSTLVMSLAPLFAALLGWLLLGENLSPTDWIGMALTLTGVSWVVLERRRGAKGEGKSVSKAGVLLALIGAAGQGGGLVLSKLGMGDYHPFASTQIRAFAGIVGFGVLFVFLGWWPRVFQAARNGPAMGYTALGATSFKPHTIMSIVPVLIIPFVVIIHKEKVSLRAVVGALIAVAGVGILFYF
jgi:drug/metabolite transporter (DMT)-like permease